MHPTRKSQDMDHLLPTCARLCHYIATTQRVTWLQEQEKCHSQTYSCSHRHSCGKEERAAWIDTSWESRFSVCSQPTKYNLDFIKPPCYITNVLTPAAFGKKQRMEKFPVLYSKVKHNSLPLKSNSWILVEAQCYIFMMMIQMSHLQSTSNHCFNDQTGKMRFSGD